MIRSLAESPGSSRRTEVSLLFLAVLALSLTPVAATAQAAGIVSGRVTDATGIGVAGALVELRRPTGAEAQTRRTGPAGDFSFTGLTPGSYQLTTSPSGFRPIAQTVQMEPGGRQVVHLVLEQLYALEQLVVIGTRGARELGQVAAAVSVVGAQEFREGEQAINVETALRRVPGVTVQDELGTASRTRIIIRGTGTRANNPAGSGVRGVRVLVDGIPKNNAGGSAQDLINVDLESMGRIEVLRGPSSTLYGNQSGGVVNIITEEPGASPFVTYKQVAGAFGLLREHVKLGGRTGNLSYLVSAFRTDQEGFRAQSRFHSTGFHSRLGLAIDERTHLATTLSFDRAFEESPGPLTEEQFRADPRQASPVFLQNDVHGSLDEMRLGMTLRRQEMPGDGELELTGYYVPRNLGPFQQIGVRIPQSFTNRGVNARYLLGAPLGGLESRLTFGADFQNTPILTGVFNVQTGAATAGLEENATTFGLYAMEELSLAETLLLTLGLRYDHIEFSSRNLAREGSPRAGRSFRRATPKLGLTVFPSPLFSLYGNVSQGFEAPIIGELRTLPGGVFGFNDELDPQVSTNYEIGARGQPLPWLSLESAVFRQEVRDLISPVGTFPQNSFQNLGRVQQSGVELSADVRTAAGIHLLTTYSFSDFTIEDFEVGGQDISGNELPGVPRHNGFVELGYRHRTGLRGAINANHVGRFYFDNANTTRNAPHTIVNLRAGFDGRGRRLAFSPFLGINNLTDERYSQFPVINDAGRRFYNPLPGIHLFGGATVTF